MSVSAAQLSEEKERRLWGRASPGSDSASASQSPVSDSSEMKLLGRDTVDSVVLDTWLGKERVESERKNPLIWSWHLASSRLSTSRSRSRSCRMASRSVRCWFMLVVICTSCCPPAPAPGSREVTSSASVTWRLLFTKLVRLLAWASAASRISLASRVWVPEVAAMSAIVSNSSSWMSRISEMSRCFSSRMRDTSSSFCLSFSSGVMTGAATRMRAWLTTTWLGSTMGGLSTIFRISTRCSRFLGTLGCWPPASPPSASVSASAFLSGMLNPSGGLEFCLSAASSRDPQLGALDPRAALSFSAAVSWPGCSCSAPGPGLQAAASVMCFIHLVRSLLLPATSS